MKNNYHQTFVLVHLITCIHVKLALFVIYLDYIKTYLKSKRLNKNDF